MPKRPACGGGKLMTDGEWEIFWNVLDARRQRQRLDPEEEECSADECSDAEVAAEGRQPEEAAGSLHIAALVTDATSARRRNTMRSNRCGSCQACQSVDCGTCKNCLDKPRCARARATPVTLGIFFSESTDDAGRARGTSRPPAGPVRERHRWRRSPESGS